MTEVIGSFNEQIQFFVTISKFWLITKDCFNAFTRHIGYIMLGTGIVPFPNISLAN